MKRDLAILFVLFFWTSFSWGQTVAKSDSIEIMSKVKTVFTLFEKPNFRDFEKISTEKIYCINCFDKHDFREDSYMIDRKEFFEKELKKINQTEYFSRAKKANEIMLTKENDCRTDITVFFTTYKKDELAPGHEGGQLGIYFKKVNGEYKFAGLETIP